MAITRNSTPPLAVNLMDQLSQLAWLVEQFANLHILTEFEPGGSKNAHPDVQRRWASLNSQVLGTVLTTSPDSRAWERWDWLLEQLVISLTDPPYTERVFGVYRDTGKLVEFLKALRTFLSAEDLHETAASRIAGVAAKSLGANLRAAGFEARMFLNAAVWLKHEDTYQELVTIGDEV